MSQQSSTADQNTTTANGSPEGACSLALGYTERHPTLGMYTSGDGIHRELRADDWSRIEPLLDNGVLSKLVKPGLLAEFKVTSPRVIQFMEMASPISPDQTPLSFRRDAAIAFLDLWEKLNEVGFTIHDAHLSSFGADSYGRPVFHDFQRIVTKQAQKFPYASFYAHFLGPLQLAERSPELVEILNRSPSTISAQQYLDLTSPRYSRYLRKLESGSSFSRLIYRALIGDALSGLLHTYQPLHYLTGLWGEVRLHGKKRASAPSWSLPLARGLRKKLMAQNKHQHILRKWHQYQQEHDLNEIAAAQNEPERFYQGERERSLWLALKNEQPGTLLDVGANKGLFSFMAAHQGFKVLSVDHGITMMDMIYRTIKGSGYNLPVRSAGLDMENFNDSKAWQYEADVVLALSLTHHLRRVSMIPWSRIAEIFGAVTKRTLITEFKTNTTVAGAGPKLDDLEADYTIDAFVEALSKHFSNVQVDDSYAQSANGRIMIICRK